MIAAMSLPARSAAHPAAKAASCGCSLAANAHRSARAASQPGDLPDLSDMTPSQRFQAFLENFQDAMAFNGIDPDALQVDSMQQIVFTPPQGGTPVIMNFGPDGYVSSVTSGAQSVRYHHNGIALYGYDIKDPDYGYANYTTILSTQWNDDGFILSSTWHPTGQTTTYSPPPPPTPMTPDGPGGGNPPAGGNPPGAGGASFVVGRGGMDRVTGTTFNSSASAYLDVSQTQQAKAEFNDRERTIKNNRKNCNASAANGYWQCLGTAGVAVTVASGLAGGGLGGLVGGPAGVAGGAIIGVGIGGAASVAGCVANAIAGINTCTSTYRNDTNKNIAQYNADIARAASNAR